MDRRPPPSGRHNWGRWGNDDERGALNLLTPDVVAAAATLCRTGAVYPLGLPIQHQGMPTFAYRGAPQRLSLRNQADTGAFLDYGAPDDLGANEDILVLASHNETHLDALSHIHSGGSLYNGFPATSVRTGDGSTRSAGFQDSRTSPEAAIEGVLRIGSIDHGEGHGVAMYMWVRAVESSICRTRTSRSRGWLEQGFVRHRGAFCTWKPVPKHTAPTVDRGDDPAPPHRIPRPMSCSRRVPAKPSAQPATGTRCGATFAAGVMTWSVIGVDNAGVRALGSGRSTRGSFWADTCSCWSTSAST